MQSAGKVLFLAFFDICRMRKGPQDIPGSTQLLTCSVMLYFVFSTILVSQSQSFEKAILATSLEVVLMMIFTQALLQLSMRASRWKQTVTAMCGTSLILGVMAIPIYILLGLGETGAANGPQTLALLLLAFLTCWHILIMAHILRHALELHFVLSMLLAMAYLWIIFGLTSAMVPMEIN